MKFGTNLAVTLITERFEWFDRSPSAHLWTQLRCFWSHLHFIFVELAFLCKLSSFSVFLRTYAYYPGKQVFENSFQGFRLDKKKGIGEEWGETEEERKASRTGELRVTKLDPVRESRHWAANERGTLARVLDGSPGLTQSSWTVSKSSEDFSPFLADWDTTKLRSIETVYFCVNRVFLFEVFLRSTLT